MGSCIAEQVRSESKIDQKLVSFLSSFDQINPIDLNLNTRDLRKGKVLIYASLGTIFNNNYSIYQHVIDAIETFDQEPFHSNSKLKRDDLSLLISVGQEVYRVYEEKMLNENYILPKNVLIMPSVPQIDILKRCSLFITHAGMNSASESIHFAVPMICIPIQVDQPLVAIRICDELNLGKRLDIQNLSTMQLRNSIHQVLGDRSYLERILEYSKISRKYNGSAKSAAHIIEFMNTKQ
jgi:MGT family glycosyltransferase